MDGKSCINSMENGEEKPFAVAELKEDGSCSIEPVTVKITFEMCNLDMDSSFILDEMKAHVRFDKKDITPSFFFDAPIKPEECKVFDKMETWNLCDIEGAGSFSSREVNLSLKMQGVFEEDEALVQPVKPGNKSDKSRKGKGSRGKGGKSNKFKSGKGGKSDKSSKTSRSGKSSKGGKGKGSRSDKASKGGKGKGNKSDKASKGGKGKGNRSDKASKRGKSSKYSNAKGYYVGKGQRDLQVGANDDETRYLRKQKPCKCKSRSLKTILFYI